MKTAIAVQAYNRPHYLRQALQAVALCDQGWDVHVFLDSPIKSKDGLIDKKSSCLNVECYRVIKQEIPEATIHWGASNAGPSVSNVSIKAKLFDVLDYDAVICLCDDFVPTFAFWRTINKLLVMSADDDRYGLVMCYSERKGEEHSKYYNSLTTCGHLVCYGLCQIKWNVWKDDLMKAAEIYHTYKHPDYYDKIRDWLNFHGFGFRSGPECDACLIALMIKHGQVPVSTVANLGEYIGKDGEFGDIDSYNRHFKDVLIDRVEPAIEQPDQGFFDHALKRLREIYNYSTDNE